MDIRENLILGIDLGIGSCGWAIIDEANATNRITAMGVRTFDVPETDKNRTPTNQLRRQHRGLRTVIRRRRQRMNAIRLLFQDFGLLSDPRKGALKISGLDPWALRAEGLDRRLTGPELAVVLGHIAKHRGFRSNSKRDRGTNAPKESSDMLRAIDATHERLKNFRTVGEMFATDAAYSTRKRNRDGDYTRSLLREDQEREVRLLFDRQRAAGNHLATEALEEKFSITAFSQRPLTDSEDKVGPCPFEPDEKRAAKHSYSFELFRFLSRLTALRIQSSHAERPLTSSEIGSLTKDFGSFRGMTFKRMRKLIGLDEAERFTGVPVEDEGKRDIVSRTGDLASGSYALRTVLGDAWQTLLMAPDKLDRIAFVLSFREEIASIEAGLERIGLEPLILEALTKGVRDGRFAGFKGAGHISAKACRNIIPHLKRGLVYSAACEAAAYNHAQQPETDQGKITNPIARKALTEAIKQVRAIIHEYGLPGRIHIELARDVGKSKDERDEITRGIEKRNKAKDTLREQFIEDVGINVTSSEDLLRYELWREQNGRCLYTDQPIHPNAIVASDNSIQVDHILPWSRSGDDSFVNKTLCFASANQEKKGRTPWDWFKAERTESDWDAFVRQVESNKAMKGRKKRNFLLRDSSVLEKKFRPRNLNDTRTACTLLMDVLERMYTDDGKRRVFARPGPLTDRLRRAWGIQGLKKDAAGNRVDDDRHHALDALVVAATTEGTLQRLTRAFQEAERIGARRDFAALDPPWPGFVSEAKAMHAGIFVSRAERRRARGEVHGATIREVDEVDGRQIVYERRSIDDVTEKDLERVRDPQRNAKLIASLREWIADGKPKGRRPLSPKGDPIAKVRLRSDTRPGVSILRGLADDKPGAADRSRIVRVDIFENKAQKRRSRYLFVPVYAHQVNAPTPPDRIFALRVDYGEWPRLPEDAVFLFSLYPMCFVEASWKARGANEPAHVEGYFRGINVNDGRIMLSDHRSKASSAKELQKQLSPTTILELRKSQVDRLGNRFPVPKETRTWRGAACT